MKVILTVSSLLYIFTISIHWFHVSASPDVIIIGAGAAGIAAATRLDKQGISVMILEAEPRIGGRIHSVPFGDAIVDLGAEWVHGDDGNIVYEIMNNSHILNTSFVPEFQLYSSDRSDIDPKFSMELYDVFMQVLDSAESAAAANQTLGDYFIKRFVNLAHEIYLQSPDKYRIAVMAMDTMQKYTLTDSGACTWFEPSAMDDIKLLGGNYHTTWSGQGYVTFLKVLMKDFNAVGKLFTEKTVTKIELLPRNGVRVSGDGFNYEVPHVIFTPSLGVLKHNHEALFEPALSAEKREAIEAIGYGAVTKVMVHYSESWWTGPDKNFTGIRLLWTYEDRDSLVAEFTKGPQRNGKSWLSNMVDAFAVPKNPNVLSLWFVGEFIPDIEMMSDDILMEGITYALEKFIGHLYLVQRPDEIVRAKWYFNKHFRGVYSYGTLASHHLSSDAYAILAEPISLNGVPRILFAGEATNEKHHSMVHGAVESGFREADRLIKVLNFETSK